MVSAQRHALIGKVESSSQGTVTRAQLETRPVLRTGELLETVPGLVVTQHSGDGKANQYFLRGFNLDHGTDLATSVDGIPVNMHTHGHGQGYTDINFVIPELLDRIEYKKGTYYADEGNFSAAGAIDLRYRRTLDDTLLSLTLGEDSYTRAACWRVGAALGGGDLLWGLDYGVTDGPWDLEEDLRRVNALVKYSRGERNDGWSVDRFRLRRRLEFDRPDSRARGDVGPAGPIRLRRSHQRRRHHIATRFRSMSRKPRRRVESLDANAYALDYRLDLFSNFTYALDTGERRPVRAVRRPQGLWPARARFRARRISPALPGRLEFGFESRFDDIGRVGLYLTDDRVRLTTIREDAVQRLGLGFHRRTAAPGD